MILTERFSTKYLKPVFRYASQAGISISIEDLKIPFVKNLMLEKANKEIFNAEGKGDRHLLQLAHEKGFI